MEKKSLILIILFLLCNLSGKSQMAYDIDLSSDTVAVMLHDKLKRAVRDTFSTDFLTSWERLDAPTQKKIKYNINQLYQKKYSFEPLVSNYLQMLNLGIQVENLNPKKLEDLLEITRKVIEKEPGEQINQYFEHLKIFFKYRSLHDERAHKWLFFNDSYNFVYKEEFVPEITPEEVTTEHEDTAVNWEEEEPWPEEEIAWEEEEEDVWAEENAEEPAGEQENWDEWNNVWQEEVKPGQITEDDRMLLEMKLTNRTPVITGPAIEFISLDLNLITPYDSVVIKNTSGTFDLLKKNFVGKNGSFNWEVAGLSDVEATFPDYHINTSKGELKAENASLTYPEKFDGEIEGIFYYKSIKRDTIIENTYPLFKSYFNNVEIKTFGEDVEYIGGFTLAGQNITSESVVEGNNYVTIREKNKKKFRAISDKYFIEDSVIFTRMSKATIYHGRDSIYHPAVRMRFNSASDELIIQKAKNAFRNTPYTTSYFNLSFQADIIRWNINEDSLDISILQGRNIVPAKFESIHHYNEADYRALAEEIYNFHPLGIVVNYAKENELDQFYTSDLSKHYKLDEEVVHQAMIGLLQKGLINYIIDIREIKVTQKARHLFDSKFQLVDYDNIIIPSVTDESANATIDFNEGYIRIRGVEEFLISDSLFVKIEPDSAELVMYENRDFSFNGKVTAGNFEYIGRDFTFNYDSFLIKLRTIDSVRFYIQEQNAEGQNNRHKVNNALVGLDSTTASSAGLVGFANRTSGTLYINTPGNKSNRNNVPNYPKFAAGEGAVVYFDRNNVLNGVYNKDIYFVIPPFDIDSLNDSDPAAIGFDGIFVSKGMIPNLEERLHYVGNNAMGFEHTISDDGYELYNGKGRIYGELNLNSSGLRTDGRVEFLTTGFDSHDILLHPDSLVATGSMASIKEMEANGIMFPQAKLDSFKVKWIPEDDQMVFFNKGNPFTFYNGIASFRGEVMVQSDGVFGKGTLEMKGSTAKSNVMKFEHNRFLARNADFEVETTNPDKPALAGKDVRVLFDLENNFAEISPEVEGQAALEFPYAQFKTSITNARWNLDAGTISMTKPMDVPLSSSYFYTTREDLDSLSFNANKAVYDINTQEMTISGIPHIKVADALITPENNEVLILENSRIGQLTNTTIILDTLNGYHRLTDGVIDIISRNEFTGYATYQFVNASQDTFAIKMENFRLERIIDENDRKNEEGTLHTVTNGSVTAQDNVIISPGMFYKGDMILYAHQPAMELDGYVKLNFTTIPGYDTWIEYSSNAKQQEVMISFNTAVTEEGKKLEAGLLFNAYDRSLYSIFVNEKLGLDDEYFFIPEGILHYEQGSQRFIIEDTAKASGAIYQGKHFAYEEGSGNVFFEGPVNFLKNTKEVEVQASVIGKGNIKEEQYGLNSLLTFNFNIPATAYELMAADIIDVVTNLGAPEGRGDQTELLYKLSNVIGERATREFETASQQEYVPLGAFAAEISKPLTFSDVNLKWSPEYKGFYSEGMLGMSNILRNEVNGAFEGFLELKKNEYGGPVVNIFVKASGASWYYFGLEENRLLIYSSNPEFNEYITKRSNASKAKLGELAFLPGTEAEVLDFINRFRFEYYGINTPYIIDAQAKVEVPAETPDEEGDDGFGDDGF